MCIALLALLAIEAAVAVFFANFLVMASDACGPTCDTTPIAIGFAVADGGTIAVCLAAAGLSARAWSRGQLSFFWPLLAAPLIPACLFVAEAIAMKTGS